jgi:hypothetical protein
MAQAVDVVVFDPGTQGEEVLAEDGEGLVEEGLDAGKGKGGGGRGKGFWRNRSSDS